MLYQSAMCTFFVFIRNSFALIFTENINSVYLFYFRHNVINILSFRLLINIKVYLCRWKPFGFPVYCNNNNEFFKHEVDVNSDM